MGTGDLCLMPQAAVRHGRARQSSGKGRCGDCRRAFGCRARGVSVRGKFEKLGYKSPCGKT